MAFAFSAASSRPSAATTLPIVQRRLTPSHLLHSATLAEPVAIQKCQFSGSLPHTRLPFRRNYCTNGIIVT
ncbi:MAG: hypothetical protein H0X30_20355 [Anaerolineae bacterium]|nr:hypothetical protein [Anaerolineae bacterium]